MDLTSDSRTLWEYNCLDTLTTARVYYGVKEELEDLSLGEFYRTLVHPLTLAVRRMANRGLYVNRGRLERLRHVYDAKVERHERMLQELVGRPFNPNSGDEVRHYLFKELGLKSSSKTKAGKDSVDHLALLKLGLKYDSPFFKVLLSHRKVSKLRSTYLTKTYIWPDGRVRSRFLVHGTATGRLSSRDPNFQNIPYAMRTMYGAAPGCCLIEADASQLELRLIALASGCKKLVEAFANGDDVHTLNAMAITGKSRPAITKEDRDFAKRFVYCQNYGGGAKRISEILFEDAGIVRSVRECEETLFRLRAAYPEIYNWRDKVLDETKRSRKIRNEFGRVRITFTRDDDLAGVAYNTPIQSTAADYINLAFIRMHELGLPLVNQVHDSVMCECPIEEVEDVIKKMKQELERPVDIFGHKGVVLPCEVKVGTMWGALKSWL